MAKNKDPHWMEHMNMDKGALHRETKTPAGKNIPESKIKKAEHSKNPKERKRAELAETFDKERGKKK